MGFDKPQKKDPNKDVTVHRWEHVEPTEADLKAIADRRAAERAAGKKVLFCSDGDFREFAGDIVAAGADGLIFEPVNDFGWLVDRFGAQGIIRIGVVTFGVDDDAALWNGGRVLQIQGQVAHRPGFGIVRLQALTGLVEKSPGVSGPCW